MPPQIVSKSKLLDEFINEVYPNLKTKHKSADYLRDRVVLTPKNKKVDELNDYILNEIPDNNVFTFESRNSLVNEKCIFISNRILKFSKFIWIT